MSVECVTTPGTRILPAGNLVVCQTTCSCSCRALAASNRLGLRLHPQHDIDHVDHLDVVGMRTVPAAPAEMISDLLLGDVAQCMIESLDADHAALEECSEAHRY